MQRVSVTVPQGESALDVVDVEGVARAFRYLAGCAVAHQVWVTTVAVCVAQSLFVC